jgi:hypothetical protein
MNMTISATDARGTTIRLNPTMLKDFFWIDVEENGKTTSYRINKGTDVKFDGSDPDKTVVSKEKGKKRAQINSVELEAYGYLNQLYAMLPEGREKQVIKHELTRLINVSQGKHAGKPFKDETKKTANNKETQPTDKNHDFFIPGPDGGLRINIPLENLFNPCTYLNTF